MQALERACAWIDSRLPSFVVGRQTDMASIKAVGELAHAADTLARCAQPAFATRGRAWLSHAVGELAGGERVREIVARSPMYAPAAIAYLGAHLAGHDSPRLIAALAGAVRRVDLPPLAWTMLVPTLEIYGIEPSDEMVAAAARMSVLAHRTEPDKLPPDAVYVLAHECLYATRWARVPPPWSAPVLEYVARALPNLIDRFARSRDADLVAELAFAARAVGASVPANAWKVMQAAQTRDGNVIPPEHIETLFPRLPHPTLERTYHTTLVAVMAWIST